MIGWLVLVECRSVSCLFGWMNSWLLDGELVAVFVGKLISVWVGSLVCWSVDGLPIGSLVRLFGGTVGHCVGQLFCGRLEEWLVRFLVGLSVGRSLG